MISAASLQRIFLIGAIIAALTNTSACAQPSGLPRVTATLAATPSVLYSWARDHCSPSDSPDAEARAFRDAGGAMHLFVVGQEAFAWIGRDLSHLRHDCRTALRSIGSKDPARFSDAMWLASTYTADGRTVFGLVHNEFHASGGNSPSWLCPSRDTQRCSYVSLVATMSANGGETFQVLPPPMGVVVTSPYRYQPDGGFAGYMNPSNVIAMGGNYYVAFNAVPFRAQAGGVCLMRTKTLNDPSSWRAWDGMGFNVAFLNPYVNPDIDPERSVCKPLGPGLGQMQGVSLVQHLPDGVFIMIGQQAAPTLRAPGGFLVPFVSTSLNLVNWSKAEPLLSTPDAQALGSMHYPTLIDPASTDRNFATAGDTPHLIYVHNNKPPGYNPDRNVMDVPLAVHLIAR